MRYDWDSVDGAAEMDVGPTLSHPMTRLAPIVLVLTVTDDVGSIDSNGTVVTIPEPGSRLGMLTALVALSLVARSRRAWAR